MIAHLRGRILEKQPTRLVVETGGIGLEVLVPLTTAQAVGEVGEEVSLHTVLVVREDALTLYGFRDGRERALFLKLISVSGIGPKIALNALSVPSIAELVEALRDQDLAFLTRLPGIGKKTAERMSLELKDALTGVRGRKGARGSADAPTRTRWRRWSRSATRVRPPTTRSSGRRRRSGPTRMSNPSFERRWAGWVGERRPSGSGRRGPPSRRPRRR